MSEEMKTGRSERAKAVSEGMAAGHLDAVLSRKDILIGLKETEAARLAKFLDVTRVASDGCCTGG